MALDENVVVCGMGGYGLVWLELDGGAGWGWDMWGSGHVRLSWIK